MIHTVRLSDVPAQPWRNGGGSTCELLVWPASGASAGASAGASGGASSGVSGGASSGPSDGPSTAPWQCRISVARIEQNGPFSPFPGVERWFAVVQGEGVVLRFANRRALLSVGSQPLRFEGASAPQCDLLDGATQDLNLMGQSAAGRAGMFTVTPGEDWDSSAKLRAVYTACAASLEVDGEPALSLPAHTLAYSEQAAHQRWRLTPSPSPSPQALASASDSTRTPGAWWMQFKPRTT